MPYCLQKLHFYTLTFLLLIPLFVIGFAISGELLTNELLSRSYSRVNRLLVHQKTVKAQLTANVLVTIVEVEKEQDSTIVEFQTKKSILQKMVFQVQATKLNTVKAIIIKEIGQTELSTILQSGRVMQVKSTFKVLRILAEIQNKRRVTIVKVSTANCVLKNLEFEIPVTDFPTIKTTITQQLGLTREDISKFVIYRIKN